MVLTGRSELRNLFDSDIILLIAFSYKIGPDV